MSRKKILFADDDPEIREVLSLLLSSEGYEAISAANGTELLSRLDDTVDLVILDVMMPGLSGYAACAEIRKRWAVPILFLTAKSQDSDKTLGFSVGGDDYLVKPFSYTELISRVKAMLRRYYVYGAKHAEQSNLIHCCGNIEIDPSQCMVRQDGKEIPLTDTEYRILYLMASHTPWLIISFFKAHFGIPARAISGDISSEKLRNARSAVWKICFLLFQVCAFV